MNTNDDDTTRMNRRKALQILGAGLGAATALVALGGSAAQAAEAAASCKTKVPLDPTATQMRRTLQYQEKSAMPGKKCSSCAHFLDKKYGECGGCKLFGGAVNPNGGCLSWAPKAA